MSMLILKIVGFIVIHWEKLNVSFRNSFRMFNICVVMSLYDLYMGECVMNCSICNEDFEGFGKNAQPVNDGVCCDDCNNLVIRRRIFDMVMDNEGDN